MLQSQRTERQRSSVIILPLALVKMLLRPGTKVNPPVEHGGERANSESPDCRVGVNLAHVASIVQKHVEVLLATMKDTDQWRRSGKGLGRMRIHLCSARPSS